MNVYLSKESYTHYVAVDYGNKFETHLLLHTYTAISSLGADTLPTELQSWC